MKRRRLLQLFCGFLAAASATAWLVGLTSSPASAATPCGVADPYARRTVSPANATGGAADAGAKFGSAVAIGDFNKDGFADVAIGAQNDKVGSATAGSVTVFNGSAGGMSTTGKRLTESNSGWGNESGDRFGAALAAADFNKDGYADLAVGSPGEAVGSAVKAGAIHLFKGSASGLSSGTGYDQTLGGGGDEANDGFGSALAAGDLNGDSYPDLVIGVPNEQPANETTRGGAVYIYKGASSGIVRGWTAVEEDAGGATEAGDQFGATLAIGNVTSTSHADLVIGAPGEAPGSDPAGGAIYIVPGAADGKGTGFGKNQAGNGGSNEAGDQFGAALAIGNFDKDGFADIAVGVPGEAPGSAPKSGSLTVFPGQLSQLGAAYVIQESASGEQLTAGDRFAAALGTGDVDKDGHADLLVGAPGKSYGSATRAGAAFLYRGRPRETGSTAALLHGVRIAQFDVREANESGDALGGGVALGDLTGDGKAEAVIGASGEAPSGLPNSGVAHQLSGLAPTVTAPIAKENYTPTNGMQGSPEPGATLGKLDYGYTDNIGRLLHGHQPNPDSYFSVQWTVLLGTEAFAGKPTLGEQADGRLIMAAHNITGRMWVSTQAAKATPGFGPWLAVERPMKSHAVLARLPDGRLVAFAVDPGGVLWALPQSAPNSAFTSWLSLGLGGLAGPPTAATVSGGIRIFTRDVSGELRTALYTPQATLTGCTSVSEPGFTTAPTSVVYPGSTVRLFVRGGDGSILTKVQDSGGGFPAGWQTVGVLSGSGAASAVLDPASGKTKVVALGGDGAVYANSETVQGSGEWGEWIKASDSEGTFKPATDPTAFELTNSNGPGWVFLFRTADNSTLIFRQTSGAAFTRQELSGT